MLLILYIYGLRSIYLTQAKRTWSPIRDYYVCLEDSYRKLSMFVANEKVFKFFSDPFF